MNKILITLIGLTFFVNAHETLQPTSLIAPNSLWQYDDDGQEDTDWKNIAFDASAWSAIKVPLGYGEDFLNTPHVKAKQLNYYIRHEFEVKESKEVESLTLRARYDDAFIAYLNGKELMRSFKGDANPVPSHEGMEFETFRLSSEHLYNGRNVLAVKLINTVAGSSDIVWDAHLFAAPALPAGGETFAEAQTGVYKMLRGPYLQNACEDAITIRWRTSIAAKGRVEYRLEGDDKILFKEEPFPITEHSLRLTGLTTATTYKYRIAGEKVEFTFRTLPQAHVAAPTRVWIIGDSGTGNKNARDVYHAYRDFTKERPTDVWLMLGDNAYGFGTDKEYQNAVFNMYMPLLHNTCVWPAVGNHETYWAYRDDNPLTHNLADPYLAIFDLPTKGEAGGVPSGSELYYSFDYGRTHFICLDSQINIYEKNGDQMYQWLKADLEQVNDEKYDWVIAYWHHVPYTHGTHNSDIEWQHIQMREKYVPLLEKHGVDLNFGGHSHVYERSILMQGHYGLSDTYDPAQHALDTGDGRPAGDGGYKQSEHQGRGTIYTVAGTSGSRGRFMAEHLPFMKVNLNEFASVVVDIDGKRVDVTTIGAQGQVLDSYTLEK